MGSELDEPLLSSHSAVSMAPRILDRDGTFSQSRGRWSVANSSGSGGGTSQGFGSARQRRPAANVSANAAAATRAAGSGTVPFGVAQPPLAQEPRHTPNSGCCLKGDQPTLTRRCWDDWFHTLSYTPTCILMLGVFIAYVITIVIFAILYLWVNKIGQYYGGETSSSEGGGGGGLSLGTGASDVEVSSFCGMDINNHMEALYFSLSTMATIGYGTSDYYFGDCWTPFILVLLQVFSALLFSSLAIGLLFQRMSRGQKRGRTIVFSDVAVIRKVKGRWYWMFRVAELRKRHIIGAKVRVFCVRHERCPVAMAGEEGNTENGGNNLVELETAHYVSHPLPLLNVSQSATARSTHPPVTGANEEESHSECSFEQSILMGLPHVVVHRMDSLSPIMPPRPVWYDLEGVPHGGSVSSSTLTQAAPDSIAENNDAPFTLLATEMEEGGPAPPSSSLLQSPIGNSTNQPTQEEITYFLKDRQSEIIVFLEGICEVTGMALQARHSYCMTDMAFHQTFAPCIFPAAGHPHVKSHARRWNPFAKSKAKVDQESRPDGISSDEVHTFEGNAALEVDFSQFHDLLPVPYDSMSCPYIPSSSF